jgi:hypothetical protein
VRRGKRPGAHCTPMPAGSYANKWPAGRSLRALAAFGAHLVRAPVCAQRAAPCTLAAQPLRKVRRHAMRTPVSAMASQTNTCLRTETYCAATLTAFYLQHKGKPPVREGRKASGLKAISLEIAELPVTQCDCAIVNPTQSLRLPLQFPVRRGCDCKARLASSQARCIAGDLQRLVQR